MSPDLSPVLARHIVAKCKTQSGDTECLAAIAAGLRRARADLGESNERAQLVQEERLLADMREFITNESGRYKHGGMVNAVNMIAHIAEELAEIRCEGDYVTAARRIERCAADVDLRYGR